jgi:hypothetical protein
MSVNATLPVTPGAPEWLNTLVSAIASAGMQPRDQRVQTLWNLLRTRGLLNRSQWLKIRLRYFWQKGLQARPRPRTTQRLTMLLQRWGILAAAVPGIPTLQQNVNVYVRGRARPYRPLRPVHVRRIGRVQPIARAGRRR